MFTNSFKFSSLKVSGLCTFDSRLLAAGLSLGVKRVFIRERDFETKTDCQQSLEQNLKVNLPLKKRDYPHSSTKSAHDLKVDILKCSLIIFRTNDKV